MHLRSYKGDEGSEGTKEGHAEETAAYGKLKGRLRRREGAELSALPPFPPPRRRTVPQWHEP